MLIYDLTSTEEIYGCVHVLKIENACMSPICPIWYTRSHRIWSQCIVIRVETRVVFYQPVEEQVNTRVNHRNSCSTRITMHCDHSRCDLVYQIVQIEIAHDHHQDVHVRHEITSVTN